jgi:hypothetical protein
MNRIKIKLARKKREKEEALRKKNMGKDKFGVKGTNTPSKIDYSAF